MRHRLPARLAAAAVALTALVLPTGAFASHSPNNTPLDLEHVLQPNYYAGLSVFNLYWDSAWDTNHPTATRASIDAATAALFSSSYGARLTQYDVPASIGFAGSAGPIGLCGNHPGAITNTPSILLFMACEEATPGSGVPFNFVAPFATTGTIYNLILPVGTDITDVITNPFDGSVVFANGSCNAAVVPVGGGATYGAYHALVPSIPLPLLELVRGGIIYFTVLPADCATDASGALSLSSLMSMISHEVVETATDPVPLGYWYDLSTAIAPGGGGLFSALTAGEAVDICEGSFGDVPFVPAGIPMTVAAYWSNSDDACVVGTSRVVTMTFAETGVPAALRTLDVGGTARSPGTTPELEGTSFAFPAMIADPNPDVRYMRTGCTGGPASGTVTFPAGNVTANASDSISCAYAREVFVRIATAPAAAATGNASLTSSQWVAAGSALSVTGDAIVGAGAGSRYDFRRWSDGSVAFMTSTASFAITAPVTITATYQLQHLVGFDESGIPAATTWHVDVAGSNTVGPTSRWFDEGTSVAFSYETPVSGTVGTQYVLSGTSTASPLTVAGPVTVVGTYGAEYLLHVSTSGLGANLTSVSNGSVSLGSANDLVSVERFFPAGTVVDLQVDDPVNGLGGVQYFFNGFAPAPPATLTAPFSTTAEYETMEEQIDDALSSGAVKNAGLANSYREQWANVTADLSAGAYAAALDHIEAFVNHLDAQAGKGVTAGVATTLRLDAAAVYHYALCQAVAAGQLTPAEHAARYAWYAALVTSLGGTPEPDC